MAHQLPVRRAQQDTRRARRRAAVRSPVLGDPAPEAHSQEASARVRIQRRDAAGGMPPRAGAAHACAAARRSLLGKPEQGPPLPHSPRAESAAAPRARPVHRRVGPNVAPNARFPWLHHQPAECAAAIGRTLRASHLPGRHRQGDGAVGIASDCPAFSTRKFVTSVTHRSIVMHRRGRELSRLR